MKRFSLTNQTKTQSGCRGLGFRELVAFAVMSIAFLAQKNLLALDDQGGQQWALLIGAENYEKANPLSFTINDVDQLAATLRERGGTSDQNIIKFVDTNSDRRRQPLRDSLLNELPDWFRKPKSNDRVIVYYSGHGFQSQDGRLYLAPLDCDPANPIDTGISVAWLRDQIAACQAKFKLLVIDSCHAGTEKGEVEFKGVSAKDLGQPFRDLEGVVTLASSTGDEKSQIWSEKRQSLFTYWLNQGLKGHADDNGDGQVDIDELNKYVHENVTHTANSRFHRSQTPVRIIRPGTPGVPVVMNLVPTKLQHLISDMADRITWAMESRGLSKVGVMQFTTDTKFGEALGGEFGALGRWCSAELEQKLLEAGTFDVMDSRELINALQKQKFTVDQLGSRDALASLSASLDGLPAIVTGTLRHRQHRTITLQSKLKQLESNSLAGAAGGTALLNEHEWAMLGYSVAIQPEDRPAPIPGYSPQDELIRRLDQRANQPHPMRDPRFPYRVTLVVNGKKRQGKYQGNDLVVPVREGEVYELWVEVLNNQPVYMRLLIDGLNTLPEKSEDETKGVQTVEVAPIVKLDEARGWILDPQVADTKVFAIRGFVTETGVAGKLRRFVVSDVANSLAAQKNFTENVGLITAAFYTPSQARFVPGTTVEDRETSETLRERGDLKAGEMISVVSLRYVDADQMQ